MASRGQRERDDGTRETVSDPDLVAGAKRAAGIVYAESAAAAVAITALVYFCPG